MGFCRQIRGEGYRCSRREFVLASLIMACTRSSGTRDVGILPAQRPDRSKARLMARPGPASLDLEPGVRALGLARGARDGLVYVPSGYRPERRAPFILMLHGAGGSAQDVIANSGPLADATNTIILGVDSRGPTWDILSTGYGPDVAFIDRALDWAFARCAVDPAHLAIGGFSDGASYALSLGIANGDLFSHIIAFSPGFMLPPTRIGRPRIFISHGSQDQILSIESTSRVFVPQLRQAGYPVEYREFAGPHTVPFDIAREALEWFSRP
jgi:phospholipase/carboxylesterase